MMGAVLDLFVKKCLGKNLFKLLKYSKVSVERL